MPKLTSPSVSEGVAVAVPLPLCVKVITLPDASEKNKSQFVV